MLWLARALELAPPDETAMRRVIRANLNAWSRELNSLEAIFPHEQAVIAAAFSPDGELVLTGSNDDTAQLWSVRTGEPLLVLPHNGDAHEVSFSSDGSRILTSDYGNTAFLWDTSTGQRIHTFTHEGIVPAAAFGPNDAFIVTGTSRKVQFWDAESGDVMDPPLEDAHMTHVLAVRSDGCCVVTACHDKSARV